VPLITTSDFEAFALGLSLERVAVHLDAGPFSPGLLALYLNHMTRRSDAVDAGFTTAFDPVGEIARSGRRDAGMLELAAGMVEVAASEHPAGRVLQIGATTYHNAGATPVQETALLLASAAETFVQLIDRGAHARDIIRQIHIAVPVASSYFVEIAKLRALRLTLAQLFDVFLPGQDFSLPPIHGETSERNLTLYDPHANMLRTTTEAASAIVGGCDVVSVRPFDEIGGRFDGFSYRMARNTGHILRHEAGMRRVVDPAAGSYYVEFLTDAIARRAWQLFQDIEARGGLLEALASGFVHEQIQRARTDRLSSVAQRRRVLVGTNHFPISEERRAGDAELDTRGTDIHPVSDSIFSGGLQELRGRMADDEPIGILASIIDGPRFGASLHLQREAEIVEQIRLQTERSEKVPKVMLVPIGDPAERSARANFARNFLGCGGFQIITPVGFESIDDALAALREADPEVLVLCAPDSDYGHLIDDLFIEENCRSDMSMTGIVASHEPSHELDSLPVDFILHRNADFTGILRQIQRHFHIVPGTEEVKP
jgi:methylmalonyl-CoA mutase